EAPSEESIHRARQLLERLGAADAGGITPLGREIAALPVHPRIGRLLMEGARRGCIEQAALAAALLSERDSCLRPQRGPGERRKAVTKSRSDILDRVHALELFEKQGLEETEQGRINRSAVKHILR